MNGVIDSADYGGMLRDFAVIGLRDDLFICRELIRDVMNSKPSERTVEDRDATLFELCKEAAYMLNRLHDTDYVAFLEENPRPYVPPVAPITGFSRWLGY